MKSVPDEPVAMWTKSLDVERLNFSLMASDNILRNLPPEQVKLFVMENFERMARRFMLVAECPTEVLDEQRVKKSRSELVPKTWWDHLKYDLWKHWKWGWLEMRIEYRRIELAVDETVTLKACYPGIPVRHSQDKVFVFSEQRPTPTRA